MRKKKRMNREKVLSLSVTLAIVCALVVGVFSSMKSGKDNGGTIVDLNETAPENVVFNEPYVEPETTKKEEVTIPQVVTVRDVEDETVTKEEKEVAVDSQKKVHAKYSFSENDTLNWPVKGDVVLKYNVDSTIFFKTLGLYKTNPAINISAPVGTDVVAACSGVVESISKNEETGNTVSIAIGNGYVTTYGLLKDVTLKKGMTVVAGDVIGKVDDPTKYYTQEGPNVYFKLTKDGNPVDPSIYLQ